MQQQKISVDIDNKLLKKTLFLYNALEQGWTIKKKGDLFILNKKHEGNTKYFDDKYLSTFMKENTNIDNLIKELL